MNPHTHSSEVGFHDDDRAVSSVIGVVLVVAITVVLAAIVGGSALGLTNQSAKVGPAVGMHSHWENLDDADPDNDVLVLEVQSGNPMDESGIRVVVDGETVYDGGTAGTGVSIDGWDGDTVVSGDVLTITEDGTDVFDGGSFTVYYADGEKSFVVAES